MRVQFFINHNHGCLFPDPAIMTPRDNSLQEEVRGVKREREKQSGTVSPTLSISAQPPQKKQRKELSSNIITEDEVKYYLSRRPITSKDLVRKFASKKSDMDKKKIVDQLHQIIQNLKTVEKQTIKGKLYLSLKQSSVA